MSTNNRQRMLAHIGRLAQRRRGEIGMGREPFAEEVGVASSTIKTFEFGRTEPNQISKPKIERGLGWKHGVIQDVLDAAEAGQANPDDVDLEYMDGREIPEPANRASELDDVELLTEVIRRLEGWRDALDDPNGEASTPAVERWGMFGLAASDSPGAKRLRAPKKTPES